MPKAANNRQLGIVFLHHQINEVVRNNLASLRRQNPTAVIATISAGEPLPGGYALAATPEVQALHAANVRKSGDWLVCSWFLQRREKCRKWWLVDWDVFSTIPVREYYRPVWKFPFVATTVRAQHRDPGWDRFQQIKNLPEEYQPYAMGAVPFVYLIDEAALSAICTTMIKKPFLTANAELRFATVANWCGYPPCGFSPPNDHIGWRAWRSLVPEPDIFHPVKHWVDPKNFPER
jgi:hypothetical protein